MEIQRDLRCYSPLEHSSYSSRSDWALLPDPQLAHPVSVSHSTVLAATLAWQPVVAVGAVLMEDEGAIWVVLVVVEFWVRPIGL